MSECGWSSGHDIAKSWFQFPDRVVSRALEQNILFPISSVGSALGEKYGNKIVLVQGEYNDLGYLHAP